MTESIYTFTEDFDVTPSVQADFDKNGYIIVRSLFDSEEVTLLKDALESDEGIIRYAFGRDDGEGGKIRMVLWNQPGNDITGVMARSEKVAGTMKKIQKFLPLVHVELEPGDALFFHCNLLHCSEQNHSDRRRWAFLVAYNRASNNPVIEHHHSRYVPMEKYMHGTREDLTNQAASSMTESIYPFTEDFDVTPSVQADFDKNGYIIVRSLLDSEEVKLLKDALESDEGIIRYAFGRDDGEGGRSRMVLWNQPGNDITGVMARSEKVAGTMEKLLGGEVYHYHTKLMMKDARTGGAFVWHQDYGYWYENGCIFPDMGTVFIALDQATQENGCLKVQKFLPLVHVELEPGDALFFHCNLLHRSEQNHSDKRRWAFLVAYNRASNNPVIEHHHSRYVPMAKVANSVIKTCATPIDPDEKDIWDPIAKPSVSQRSLDKKHLTTLPNTMSTPDHQQPDFMMPPPGSQPSGEESTMEFAMKMFEIVKAGFVCMAMSVGSRAGLFEVMGRLEEPATCQEIADAAGMRVSTRTGAGSLSRYVREWVGAMATSGVIDVVDMEKETFFLPRHRIPVLLSQFRRSVTPFCQLADCFAQATGEVVKCFAKDGPTESMCNVAGVPYSTYSTLQDVMYLVRRSHHEDTLVDHFIPTIPGLKEKLGTLCTFYVNLCKCL
uniref:S-adenosylmethionine-dependent methyltransferase Rv2258c-like winged HTH domain-containing protein n=1 Tax=Branchiostoma floridae TaxID=7739 RepID=C3XSQ1_BRAFL|eukprot:XP_002612963.1 hypothetical protein BRAFLDRAFT_74748 [Branchiostoma floridae]